MSRTDKDRPYWVKTNDPSLPRHESHYHEAFGRSFKRQRQARNSDGTPRYELKTESRIVLKENMGWYLDAARLDPNIPWPIQHKRDELRFYTRETYDYWVPLYERMVTRTYADHCTIDEPNHGQPRHIINPCSYSLDYWYFSPWGGVSKDQRSEFNSMKRRSQRDELKTYVKEVNAMDDWSDLDDSQLNNDRHRHSLIYW